MPSVTVWKVAAYDVGAMASPRRVRRSHQRSVRAPVGLAVGALLLAGCFTGERPGFESDDPLIVSGNPDIDAVLERLDSTPFAQFTADYDVETRLGGLKSKATAVQAAGGRRSVTINSIRYVVDGGQEATCDLEVGECEAIINNARTSDIAVFDRFYGADFAARLRTDATRRVGETTGYAITQGGEQALCVDVPVNGGIKSYCALETGPLARYNGNDLFIEMTAYSPTPDESKFATS